jgi:hypothetical protein
MAITVKDLERALLEADRAGDTTSATLFANEIKKIQAANQPQEGGVFTGMAKRGRQVVEGVKGVGLRTGNLLGIVDPETLQQYEQNVASERSVMSPSYQSTTPIGTREIIGSTLADVGASMVGGGALKAGKNIPFVGGALESIGGALLPTTVPQAAAGGALYSLTTPSESNLEMLSKAALGGSTGGLTQFGLRQVGLAPKLPSELTDQQKEVARRALQQGFVLDPTQITGIGSELKEGVKSNLPFSRRAFTRLEDANQTQTNNIAKSLINIPAPTGLTNETMQTAYNSALQKYKILENIPAVKGNQTFVNAINSELVKLSKIPSVQRTSNDKKAIRVLTEYKNYANNPITGQEAFIRSKAIGSDLFDAQKSGSKIAADAFKTLRNSFEQSIDDYLASPANLMRQNGSNVLNQFREGRKTLSDWYLIKSAFNEETGNVSPAKLAAQLSKKPQYGTTKDPIETAAMLSGAFPRAFPSSGTSERLAAGDIYKSTAGILASPLAYAATSAPVRNILAQRTVGAAPEGILGNIYGGVANVGGFLPEQTRSTLGRALMSAEQQQLNQELVNPFGLLGR